MTEAVRLVKVIGIKEREKEGDQKIGRRIIENDMRLAGLSVEDARG